jgi:hypothetical protein
VKRKVGELEVYLTAEQVQRISEGRTVIVRVGEEHDGQQAVVRFDRSRFETFGVVRLRVVEYVWDEGGPGQVGPANAGTWPVPNK